MNTSSSFSSSRQRALVLGGGGSAGNAWLIGIIAGLHQAGLDVTGADLVIGTSAGSTAAAQITGPIPPAQLLAGIMDATAPQRSGPSGPPPVTATARGVTDHLDRLSAIIASAKDAPDMRRRLGAAILAQDGAEDGSATARWRETVRARLSGLSWPDRDVFVTAVDARTGESVVFDRHSGVDLVDAVAASTSNGFGVPPFAIGADRYIDGGYRRNENADLADGYERVLVLSPLGGRTLHPLDWGMQLAAQVHELEEAGSRVHTILPDVDSLTAFGDNMMDLSRRPLAARAGYEQGRATAGPLAEFWS